MLAPFLELPSCSACVDSPSWSCGPGCRPSFVLICRSPMRPFYCRLLRYLVEIKFQA